MPQEEEILGKAYDSRLMRRLIKYLNPYKWQVVVAIVLAIVTAALGPLRPYLTQVIIDKHIVTGNMNGMWLLIWILVASMILQALAQYALAYLTQWIGQRTIYAIRTQLFQHLQKLALRFFDKNPVGRLVT